MFSNATTHTAAASVRSSRRRQRPLSNEGSLAQPASKRQRSMLSENTFVDPTAHPEMAETKASKPVALVKQEGSRHISGQHKAIAVRGKKARSGDRNSKGDGSTVLTTNDTYTVSKIIAGPEKSLLSNTTNRQHGSIHSDSGYALLLSHTQATVWAYSKPPTEFPPYIFDLPHPSKHASDPLPLGSLVSPSTSSSEPGLVVVIPTSGKITYWESVDSAATMGLRLQRNNIELSIPGMFSGEIVIQILNAETAGFVLAFSSGRIAYMNVRDGQGRPTISVQFLQGGSGSRGGGLFGSLRHALSTSRGDIAAVRADQPRKVGERQVVVATAKGKIQSWDLHRGGHSPLKAETEGREAIVGKIKHELPAFSELLIETFELHDFTFAKPQTLPSDSRAVAVVGSGSGVQLLLLTSLTDRGVSHYFLVGVELQAEQLGLNIKTVHHIRSYTTPINRDATSKARLYLPEPSRFAYIVFHQAVVVVSVGEQPQEAQLESPDAQLWSESHPPLHFEDVVEFRNDMGIEVVGSGMEEPHGQPSQGMGIFKSQGHKPRFPAIVLLLRGRGGGIVRVAATGDTTKHAAAKNRQVTAKSKLEQAVYFGGVKENPINFSVRPELQFPATEIEEAALRLSNDVLSSRTPHISSVPTNVADNLSKRSDALRDLATYLRSTGVVLDRNTRWQLLWNAEKLAAAAKVWEFHDACVSRKPEGQKRSLVTDIVEGIHENQKTEPVPEQGELDRVRKWFMSDVSSLTIAVPWAWQVIKHAYQDGQKDHASVVEMLSEANDAVLGVLQTALDFRTNNVGLYGLQAEPLKNGILTKGFAELPEFWTSTILIVQAIRKQLELTDGLVKEYWSNREQQGLQKQGQPDSDIINKLRGEYATLIDVGIRTSDERIRYCLAHGQDSPQFQIEGDQLRAIQEDAQFAQIRSLSHDLSMPNEAMALAERYQLLKTLAFIMLVELSKLTSKQTNNQHLVELAAKVAHYFDKFGTSWANEFFELQIEEGTMQTLMEGFREQQAFLTAFLRGKPQYAKVGWIHEVIRENNFEEATKSLIELGLNREQDVWSKKIELSIGKLAHLAVKDSSDKKPGIAAARNQLGLIKIQDTVYEIVLQSIGAAIDENAELQLALEAYFFRGLKKQPTFSTFLEQRLADLIKHAAMDALALVDLLTLMEDNVSGDVEAFRSWQFYEALQATRYGIPEKKERTVAQRVIWRRCILRDDWPVINNTDMKDDEQVSEQSRNTALYLTFRLCLKNGLFDNDSTVSVISPEEIVGACTDELDSRYLGLDDSIRDKIMRDYCVEDDDFNNYLETCRLDQWHSSILEQAKKDYADGIAGEIEDGKNMNVAKFDLQELEESIAQKELGKAEGLLRSRHPFKPKSRISGGAGSFRSSIKQY